MPLDLTVLVHNAEWKTRFRPHIKNVRAACEAALKEGFRIQDSGFGKAKKWELSVVLADDAFIRELNKTYRGKNKPTNVLSFPSSIPESRILNPESCLGDIILALETIEREAEAQGKSFKHHATHLIVHGVLHLLGHDHENEVMAADMERKEIKILKKLGISNPYL